MPKLVLSYDDALALMSPEDELAQRQEDLKAGELDRIDKLTKDFRSFIPAFWSTVDPAPFKATWVTDALAEHLQACYERQIRRLKINIHFRSAKSTLASILWPAWIWAQTPEEKFLFMSYAEKLALTHAGHFRKCIKSPLYRSTFNGKYDLTKDSDGEIENTKLGARLSIGSASQQTGSGGGIKVFDDPNDTNKVEYVVDRENVNNRFDNMSTRSDDFATDVWVLIQQRTHPKDVSGHIDELGGLGFETLNIPLEYNGKKYVTSIGWSDRRTEKGEVTDKDRFPPESISLLKASLGFRYSGQANQEPTTPEGNAIKRSWYGPHCMLIDFSKIIAVRLAYDIGFSDAPSADWTWGSLKVRQNEPCENCGALFHTLWMHFGRWDNDARRKAITSYGLDVARMMKALLPNVKWELTEEAGVGPGVAVTKEDITYLIGKGLPARSEEIKNQAKPVRAIAYLGSCQAGLTKFYAGNQLLNYGMSDGTNRWIKPFFEEVTPLIYSDDGLEFKGGKDDPIDSEVMSHEGVTVPPKSWDSYFSKPRPKEENVS